MMTFAILTRRQCRLGDLGLLALNLLLPSRLRQPEGVPGLVPNLHLLSSTNLMLLRGLHVDIGPAES